MRPSQLLAGLVALSSVSAAWPDVFDNVNALGEVKNILYGRQDNNNNNNNNNNAESESARSTQAASSSRDENSSDRPSATRSESEASATKSGDDANTTGRATGSQRATNTRSSGKPKSTEFDPRLPAGGISMVTPSALAGSQFYKIGDWVEFAWNYTSLSATPTAIDVLVTCTANQATYTIAVNQSVEETGRVLWNTNASQTAPFLTETYTLLIYDSDSSVSATAKAGYLGVFNQFTFGMYEPQPYTPFSEYTCANCNSALSAFEKLTLKAILITSGTTIASLFYFAHSFGMW